MFLKTNTLHANKLLFYNLNNFAVIIGLVKFFKMFTQLVLHRKQAKKMLTILNCYLFTKFS